MVRLEAEMRAKVHAKASALGLDDAAYVRMLIYRDENGLQATPAPREPEAMGAVARFRQPHAAPPAARWVTDAEVLQMAETGEITADQVVLRGDGTVPLEELVPEGEPRAEDIEIPADADDGPPAAQLEELLATAPSVLDELLAAAEQPPHPMIVELARPARVPQRGYRAPLSNRDRGLVAFGGPGSRTRPIGVNDGIVGANNYGDGPGNVLRDNMRHFGFGGTRSR